MLGRRINDRYKIIEKIGGGGMADVYLARDIILERYVAVKILRLDFANDEEFIRRFHREALSATSLVHPNIVNIYDVGEEDDNIYYIVMEYVNGETLKEYIQYHSPIPVEKAVEILKQLVSAIKHAHQNNIIHRDIKPQNILIDKKGNVKITDFGIATALTSTTITHTNSMLGSVHYISPEQARGGIASRKSDIYALGIVMFEMLTGRLPFSGESAVSIALKHLQDETPSPSRWNPTIPQSVENIVLKATVKDPFYRYDDVEELEEDLHTCLESNRLTEPPFRVPKDEEATKAIPIIKDGRTFQNIQEINTSSNESEKQQQNNPTESVKPGKKKRKVWPVILIATSAVIIIIGILSLTLFPSLFGAKDIPVPDVTNYELEDAIEELEDAGFVIGETIEMSHNEIPENHVIRTDPRASRVIVEGSEINIYVSTGLETVKVPDYTDRMFEDVFAILQSQDRKFKDIEKNEVHHESEPGTIIEQNPPADTEIIPEDTVITFTISKGKEEFPLANLTDYSENALNNYADSAGIVIEVDEEVFHDTIPSGLVISQDIEPGTMITKGTVVKVVVSKGKEELPPRTVTLMETIPYTGEQTPGEGEGEEQPPDEKPAQTVEIYIRDMNNSYDQVFDTFEITETRRIEITLLIAEGQTGQYKIVVDGNTIIDQVVDYPE